MNNFSAISWREQVTFQRDDDGVRYVLDHSGVGYLQSYSLKQQSAGRHCHSTLTRYPDSEPTSICSYSLMLHAYWRSRRSFV